MPWSLRNALELAEGGNRCARLLYIQKLRQDLLSLVDDSGMIGSPCASSRDPFGYRCMLFPVEFENLHIHTVLVPYLPKTSGL